MTDLVGAGRTAPESVLRTLGPGQHLAQLYIRPESLVRAVGEYVGRGLHDGEAAVIVATPSHARAILQRLRGDGVRVPECTRGGRLAVLDAQRTLAELLVDGRPDRSRFRAVIGDAVRRAKAAGNGRVRAFGEMVEILRRTSLAAALELEACWTELLAEEAIGLVCGYAIDVLDPASYKGLLQGVVSAHSHLGPVEDQERLDRAVAQAYLEVFGPGRDAALLRREFLAHYARPAVMPDAQAAILAAREFVSAAAADELLDRVRHHYLSATSGLRAPPAPIRSDGPAARDPA